jgi:hypothetical protein
MSEPHSPALRLVCIAARFGIFTLLLLVFLVDFAGGVSEYSRSTSPLSATVDEGAALKTFIVAPGKAQKLEEAYTAANGEPVAKPQASCPCCA